MSKELKDWVKNLKVGDEVIYKGKYSGTCVTVKITKVGRIWVEFYGHKRFHKYDLRVDGGKDYGYTGYIYKDKQEYEAEVNLIKLKNEVQDCLVDCRGLVYKKSLPELLEFKEHLDLFSNKTLQEV